MQVVNQNKPLSGVVSYNKTSRVGEAGTKLQKVKSVERYKPMTGRRRPQRTEVASNAGDPNIGIHEDNSIQQAPSQEMFNIKSDEMQITKDDDLQQDELSIKDLNAADQDRDCSHSHHEDGSSANEDEEKIAEEVIDLGYNIFDQQPQLFREEIQEIERAKKKRALMKARFDEISKLSLIE